MLPVVVGITLLNVIGVVRSAPSLNLFSFGFPITMMAAFLLFLSTHTVEVTLVALLGSHIT